MLTLDVVLTAAVFLAAVGVLVLRRWRSRRPGVVVLGQGMARAAEAERRRLEEGGPPSPLSGLAYDTWRGERDLFRPRPVPLDSTVAGLCRQVSAAAEADRARLRRSLGMGDLYTLLMFSQRAAVFAMRERSVERLHDGLTAIALIERARVDPRDISMALSVLRHAAARIGQGTRAVFAERARLAEQPVADLMLADSPGEELRSAAGYHEVETGEGIGLVGWGLEDYDPTYDFVRLATEMADLIESDEYRADSVTLATEMPSVWLETADDDALRQALRGVRAGASITGWLRPAPQRAHEHQWLTVFVVELDGPQQAAALLSVSQRVRPRTYAHLGVARERLFCLVVARSVMEGVPSHETATSLGRFAAGMASILARHARAET